MIAEETMLKCAEEEIAKLKQQKADLLEACKLGVLTMIEQHNALETITKSIAKRAGIETAPIPLPPITILKEAIAKAEK